MPKSADVQDVQEAPSEPLWETIQTGLGTEHDFDRDGALIGHYVGSQTMDVRDWNSDDPAATREATAYQFAPEDAPDDIIFVWNSSEIDKAMAQVALGDLVRIVFLGVEQFTGDKGPQQVKRYRVQRAKS